MTMSMYERWEADEELEGRYAEVDDTEPRWMADGLEGYGPESTQSPPTDLQRTTD